MGLGTEAGPALDGRPRRGAAQRQGRTSRSGLRPFPFCGRVGFLQPTDFPQAFPDPPIQVHAAESVAVFSQLFFLFRRQDAIFQQTLERRAGRIVTAPEAFAVFPLFLGHQHLAGAEEVAEVRPVVAELLELFLQVRAVEADFAEQLPSGRAVLFFDMGVVVAFPGPRPPQERGLCLPSEPGRNVVVEDFAAIVGVDGEHGERELVPDVRQSLAGSVLAAVPGRGQHRPLRLAIRGVEDPEEALGRIATAQGEGVHLHVPGRYLAGHHRLARCAGGFRLDFVAALAARALVRLRPAGLHARLPGQDAGHGTGAHPQQGTADAGRDVGDFAGVLRNPALHLGLEIGCAGTSGLQPDAFEHRPGFFRVGLSAPLAVAEFPAPGQETVGVLARISRRFDDFLEQAVAFRGDCRRVCPALGANVFGCGRS